jgi:hypothetical protein
MLSRVAAKHHAVDNEGVLVAEELREAYRAIMAFEGIVFGDYTAWRKSAAQGGDTLNVTPELDLLGKQGVAALAVFAALVGEVRFILCGEFHCGDEGSLCLEVRSVPLNALLVSGLSRSRNYGHIFSVEAELRFFSTERAKTFDVYKHSMNQVRSQWSLLEMRLALPESFVATAVGASEFHRVSIHTSS